METERSGEIEPPGADVQRLAENLFREESGRLVSLLTSVFGPGQLQLAEDVAQEALVRALQTWPYYGLPENPAAWLTRTAKNLALDVVRREAVFRKKEPEISSYVEQRFESAAAGARGPVLAGEIADDTLRLIFICCHPELPAEGQAALALKTLCGFSAAEIAHAFLTSEAAVLKRLTRTRQRIRELEIPFEIPEGQQLESRMEGVLRTLYLLFNEGYKASSGARLVRRDLCKEALRLARLLASHSMAGTARAHALLALMLFNSARLEGRADPAGHLLRLREQDRTLWNSELIAEGVRHLKGSAAGNAVSRYHFEAAIAACHCTAANYESTDWKQILWCYDRLVAMDNSPVVALNRAVAVAEVHGPQVGIEAVEAIAELGRLKSYYLYFAFLGEMHERLGNVAVAHAHYRKAVSLTPSATEQAFLNARANAMAE